MARDKDVQATLQDINRKIAAIEAEIDCKGRYIETLEMDINNPPTKADVEERLERAMQELYINESVHESTESKYIKLKFSSFGS
jgi:hypothetical protein